MKQLKKTYNNITAAALQIEEFTDTLSNWYVRRNRERFWSTELNEEKENAEMALLEKMERWEYLEDLAAQIENQ